MRNGEPIDRIYGGGALRLKLIQKDGTEYTGNITKKTIIVDGINGKFKRNHRPHPKYNEGRQRLEWRCSKN